MIEKEFIRDLISDYIAENQLEIVDIKVNKANNIKVFFDIPSRPVNIDDCVDLSRYIESRLDRDKEDYSLTVSSAGKEKNINKE